MIMKVRSASDCVRLFSAGFCLLLFFPHVSVAETKRRITLEDGFGLKNCSWLELSPKGDRLAFVVADDILIVSLEKNSQPHKLVQGSMPRWAPDGRFVAYYSAKSGTNQLWLL